MSWTVLPSITTANQKETGCRIWRSLDKGTGGYLAYTAPLSPTGAEPATHYGMNTYTEEDIKGVIEAGAESIHSYVALDYANRWPDFVAPTLAEVQAWHVETTLNYGVSFWDEMATLGLQLARPAGGE